MIVDFQQRDTLPELLKGDRAATDLGPNARAMVAGISAGRLVPDLRQRVCASA